QWLFVNTHFDHRGPKARAESAKLLRTWIAEHKGSLPCVLTGDFNAEIKSDPMQNLIDAKRDGQAPALLLARAKAASPDAGPDSTWNGFKKIEPGRRIDHILITDQIQVQEFTTLDPRTAGGRFASDHLPIEVKLVLASKPGEGAGASQQGIRRLDLNDQAQRQIVVDRETGQYLGHPTTVLLEDGRTIICVYPKGHGRGPIVMKRSLDGGLTWSDRLHVPENWATSKETPTIHRVIAPDGTKRLIMFSGLYPIRMAKSEDDGRSWTPLEKIGDFGGIVAMGSVVELRPERGRYMALFHDDGRFLHNAGKATGTMTLLKTLSSDGGLTWSEPETIYQSAEMHLCEPGAVRSPDGRQLAVLLRENLRRAPSQIIFSNDEGKTWTAPRPLPWSLTGDRHTAKYASDGRLLISFRDVPYKGSRHTETAGDWVAWVGTYDDLVSGGEGQYRVRLKDNLKANDCAYPGVEVLPDDTFVITTYGHWQADEAPYILSIRLKLSDLDQMAGQ
ncbi:MAG: endonuclease/exonuclease/phosphatase family protein, partial [Aureliella sp.]